ncbi:uncharacterized protein EI90DRAFT_3016097 [Cantharellus anzutake]|uniref:uncharacterized protein n=1 Tax=Cantharellus anzutake TaxID=1750568 RepID=UPI0019066E6B|nr:uncharacterized protein EI90DRAFT_3016097 [Cantharellus anzutake]KAF8331988.1 hypothetical protein EI90DRAFT_3016097 [Cantharellus anzutake]
MTGISTVQPPLPSPHVNMQSWAHGAKLSGKQSGEPLEERHACKVRKNVWTIAPIQRHKILEFIPTAEPLPPSYSNVTSPVPTQIESVPLPNLTINHLQKDKRNLTKVAQRAKVKVQALQAEIKSIKVEMTKNMKKLDLRLDLERETSMSLESKLTKLRRSSMCWRRKSYALQQQNGRLQSRLKNSLNQTKCRRKLSLKYGSFFSFKAQSLVRRLCCLNIPDVTIGKVIKECAGFFGITLNNVPSAWTCSRIMIEAGIAAEAQIVEVVRDAKGIAYSGDSTQHKHIDYHGSHFTMDTADLPHNSTPSPEPANHKTFFLGIESLPLHTKTREILFFPYKSSKSEVGGRGQT